MRSEELSKEENVLRLRSELAELYEDNTFLEGNTMGELVSISLHMLETYPVRKRHPIRMKIENNNLN